jgi:CPA1 family monovalent cation:H+ antiporter
MHSLEIFLGLLLAALAMAILAKRLDQPYPIALVVGGMVVAFVPGFNGVRLNPELVFYVLLPPILFEAAYFTSWRDFWRWRRAIFLLAFGLVALTSVVVASLCVFLIPGMTWATALVLGAIVSPPDASAATSIFPGIRLPRRIVRILEGERRLSELAEQDK